MKRLSVIVLLCTWGVLLGIGPGEGAATTLFSMNLVGERLESADARVIALGGASQILADSLGALQKNPAILTFCRKVTFGATQLLAIDKGRSSTLTEKAVSMSYPVFVGAFPLTKRLTFALGFRGRYDPGGTFSIPGATEDGNEYIKEFSKNGGLYTIPLTMSFTLSRHAAIGATYSFERGFVEDEWNIEFDDPLFAPGKSLKREELSGKGYSVGMVLFPSGRLMLGAMYESEIEYETRIEEEFTQPGLDTSYTSSLKLPPRFNFSATWRIGTFWHVLASFAFADFTDFRGLGFSQERLFREESYAFGVEYTKGLPFKGERLPLRFSFNYERLPYDFPAGERIRKILFGLGTGLNFAGGKAKIDFAVRAGKVGSLGKNTLEDRLIRLYVSVMGSEVWKRKGHADRR